MQILYPLEDIRKVREIYYTEKIGLMLFIIFIGNTLAFFLTVHTYFQSDIYNHLILVFGGESQKRYRKSQTEII